MPTSAADTETNFKLAWLCFRRSPAESDAIVAQARLELAHMQSTSLEGVLAIDV